MATTHELPVTPVSQDPLASAPLIDLTGWNELPTPSITKTPTAAPQQQNTVPTQEIKTGNPFVELLSMFKCKSAAFPNNSGVVVRIRDNASLGDALKLMTEHRILSLPVVAHKTGKPLYILTMTDIVAYFVYHFTEKDFKTDFWTSLTNFFYVPEYCNEIATKNLSQLVGVVGQMGLEELPMIKEDQTVYEAVKLMLEKKAHRVLVLDESGYVSNLITQSRIVQFLSCVLDSSPKCDYTVRELGLGFKKIVAVRHDQIVYRAFRSMVDRKLTSLAVVNHQDQLVGNISITDFKLAGFKTQYWNYLGLTVQEYLKELNIHSAIRLRSANLYSARNSETNTPVQLLVTVKPEDKLRTVIKFITFFNVHRVFVVDEEHHPLGIITLTDLLHELLQLPQA